MKKLQYGIWKCENKDKESQYWLLFDSIEDAVSSEGDGSVVYKLEASYVGRFRRAVTLEKVKKHKKKK